MGRGRSHVRCAVAGCTNNKKPGQAREYSFFIVPKDARRKVWLKAIKKEKIGRQTKLLVCQQHFTCDDVVANDERKRLVRDAVPTRNLPESDDDVELLPSPRRKTPLPDVKLEPMDYEHPIIDLFTEEETVVSDKRTLEATEAPGTTFSLNGIPLKRESSDIEEFPTTLKADDGFESPLQSISAIPAITKSLDLNLLNKLSKAYLSPELAKFIEVQALLKRELRATFEGKECNKKILLFALQLYHSFPQTYKVMQESLYLPSMLKIRRLCGSLNWEINDSWAKVVRARFERATAEQRECVVCVARARLQLGMAYDVTRDRLTGLDEVNGVQRPRTARYATVVYVRGIFSRWLQPLSYALLATNARPDELWMWFDIVISKLFDIGLNVRAIVTDVDHDFRPSIRPIGFDKTYFQVQGKQIYCFYDCTQLFVRFRDCLRSYNINFGGMIASWEVIEELFEYDSTRRYKMVAELTAEHVRPHGAAARRRALAAEVLSPRVAAALAAAVDLRVLDDSAHGTVRLITTISMLYDILHTKELTVIMNKITPEIKFLNEMLMHFERMTFMDKNDMRNVPEPGVLRLLRADVRSALALQERLRREGHAALPLRAFNNDPVHRFFDRVRALNGDKDPMSRQLVEAFRKNFVFNIMKSFSVSEGKLDGFLKTASGVRAVAAEAPEDSKTSVVRGLVQPSHFWTLMRQRGSNGPVAGFLLEQCARWHPCCEAGIQFCSTAQASPRYVEFLQVMERTFRMYFVTDCLHDGVLATLLASLTDDQFPSPCSCFPTLFLKTLYLRYRIAKLIQFNNTKLMRNSRDFTMNLLHFVSSED